MSSCCVSSLSGNHRRKLHWRPYLLIEIAEKGNPGFVRPAVALRKVAEQSRFSPRERTFSRMIQKGHAPCATAGRAFAQPCQAPF